MLTALALFVAAQTTDRPLEPTGDYSLYTRKDVRFLRAALDGYARGKVERIDKVAVKGIQPDGSDGLSRFDKAYFKSRFMVVEIASFLGGGVTVSVLFVDKPDRMFDCWVFQLTDGSFELRAFAQDQSFTAKEIAFVYGKLLADPKNRI